MKGTAKEEMGQLKWVWDRETRLAVIRDVVKSEMRTQMLGFVRDLFQDEYQRLCGERWSRKEEHQARRGGKEKGSVYVEGRRVKVKYPRVKIGKETRAIDSYAALRDFDVFSEDIQRVLLRGISTRDYNEVIGEIQKGTKLAHGTVSRAFVRASQKDLDEINGRDLSKDCFMVLFFDGIEFAGTHVIVTMGITLEGRKILLGLREGATENAEIVKDLIESLKSRGLALTEKFLATIDGAKALSSAVKQVWGSRALIQRCQIHKGRNVKKYLPDSYHGELARRLKVAYGMEKYAEAKRLLLNTVEWLGQISEQAARSMEEGLEETLTVHRLKLPDLLRKTLATTNPIESLFDGVRHRTDRVKRWRTGKGQMAARWTASALLMGEKKLNKIKGYRLMSLLQEALKREDLDTVKEVG